MPLAVIKNVQRTMNQNTAQSNYSRDTILLSQLQAGNTYKNLNEIRQMVY